MDEGEVDRTKTPQTSPAHRTDIRNMDTDIRCCLPIDSPERGSGQRDRKQVTESFVSLNPSPICAKAAQSTF